MFAFPNQSMNPPGLSSGLGAGGGDKQFNRQILLESIREFDRNKGLKRGIRTNDRSHPMIHLPKSVENVPGIQVSRGGGSKGPKALGDLFSGGLMPSIQSLGKGSNFKKMNVLGCLCLFGNLKNVLYFPILNS
ncbi:WIPF [Lepeophtheirus salmonis]|uniref:WIPF n=1 Tax=Lepeophtheirus salmonis TaxID=72036 RepID=A0A7R8CVX0_LEPSM|nr:WIPF [Lepeophtheirus salmonis]CAF2946962.1 WIPF [Lepeophtheirus salmonis]